MSQETIIGELPETGREWRTLPRLFAEAVEKGRDRPAYHEKFDGRWQVTSFTRLRERVHGVARYLIDRGLEPGDRAALIAHNCTEWPVVDMGMHHAAVANVPIYPSSSAEQILYILADSGARVAFVENPKQLAKLREIRDRAPSLVEVVVLRPGDQALEEGERALADIEAEYSARLELDDGIEARVGALVPEDLASIVYTSGTTGHPKGVMLRHMNFAHNTEAANRLIHMDERDIHLSFLPLSHVLERTVGYYVPLFTNCQVYFAESQEKLRENLLEVRPTFMTSVPRLYEKIRDGIVGRAHAAGGFKRSLFEWSIEVGRLRACEIQGGVAPGMAGKVCLWIADRLVFEKIRAAFGGRLRFFLSGGAPLARDLGEFFLGAGVRILEGYGLTETSPMIAANRPDLIRLGTVGKPVWGVQVKIAADGEILARGPNVMQGYFGNDEATGEAIDADGWFHTGDVGEITPEGCVRITDRKKNLLVLSNGKNVAPAPIEGKLLNSPFITQSVVLGDNRNFVAALVVPDHQALKRHAAEALGVQTEDVEELCQAPAVNAFVLQEVHRLAVGFNPYEVPKKICLLPRELTEAAGELTPTLKVKRKVIMERYGPLIEALYA